MRFTKMHGLGNDYVYLDCVRNAVPADPAALAVAVSDRHFGIGSDGLILICKSEVADARMPRPDTLGLIPWTGSHELGGGRKEGQKIWTGADCRPRGLLVIMACGSPAGLRGRYRDEGFRDRSMHTLRRIRHRPPGCVSDRFQ